MSHIATNWAFAQRGLKPASKLVLLVLADCHNPVHGCFPSQAFLASECEMHRDTVNVHLAELERIGLIRRIRSFDPVSKRQKSTRYRLSFEADFKEAEGAAADASAACKAVSEIPTRDAKAVSEFSAEPCRNLPESRVGNSDTNLVREPIIEPIVPTHGFNEFWVVYPRLRNKELCKELFGEAVAHGASPEMIVQAAKRYRLENEGNRPMYLAFSDNWLAEKRWNGFQAETHAAGSVGTDLPMFWAEKIRAKRYVPPSAISSQLIHLMLERELVTKAQLFDAGFRA